MSTEPGALAAKRPPLFGGRIYCGWLAVVVGFLMAFMGTGPMAFMGTGPVYYTYGIYAVQFAKEFHASTAFINLGFTAVLVAGALSAGPVGWLADRFPLRWLAVIGAVGTGRGSRWSASPTRCGRWWRCSAPWWPISDSLLGGIVINVLISNWFERRRGLTMGYPSWAHRSPDWFSLL